MAVHLRYHRVTNGDVQNGLVAKAEWERADEKERNSGFRERQST